MPGIRSGSVIRAYVEFLGEDSAHVGVLYLVGLFDRPASPGAQDALQQHAGLLNGKISIDSRVVYELSDLRLLVPREQVQEGWLDAHPLIREYFGMRWEAERTETWKAAHGVLSQYYASTVLPSPAENREMEQLYASVHHGCQAGMHENVFHEVLRARIWRDGEQYYSARRLGMISSDLAALGRFCKVTRDGTDFKSPLPHLTFPVRVQVTLNAGYRLRGLGRLKEARECFSAVLKLPQEENSPRVRMDLAAAASESCEMETLCGALDHAEAIGRRAVELADQSADPFFQVHAQLGLAEVLFHSARRADALALIERAEALHLTAESAGVPLRHPFLYSQTCYRCCSIWLREPEGYQRVIDTASRIEDWGERPDGSLLSRAIDRLCRAWAYCERAMALSGDIREAREGIADAIEVFRKAGYADYTVRGLIRRRIT